MKFKFNKKNAINNGVGTLSSVSLISQVQKLLANDSGTAKNWAAICIKKRASAVASLEWAAYRLVKGKYERLDDSHWLSKLIERPNALYGWSSLIKLIPSYRDESGAAFVHAPNGGGEIYEFTVLPSKSVMVYFDDARTKIVKYQVSGFNGTRDYMPSEIIPFINLETAANLDTQLRGTALATKISDSINVENNFNSYISRVFKNDGAPPLALKYIDSMSQPQKELLIGQYNQQHPDMPLSLILEGGMDIVNLAGFASGSDMLKQYEGSAKEYKQNIGGIYEVPSGKITGEYQNKATADVLNYGFFMDTIEPLCREIEESFNFFLNSIEPGLCIYHTPYSYTDKEQERLDREHYIKTGIKTLNTVRAELGLVADAKYGNNYLISNDVSPMAKIFEPTPTAPVGGTIKSIDVKKKP